MSGSQKYKLTKQEIEEIQADTISSNSSLAREYKVDRTTIIYHKKKAGKKPKMKPHYGKQRKIPLEVLKIKCSFCGEMFDRLECKVNKGNNFCSTKCCRIFNNLQRAVETETEEQKLLKKQNACEHIFWVKRCSLCNKIIASDSKNYDK